MDDRQVVRYWRIFRTVHQMVNDRGYAVAQDELDLSLEDFRNQYCTGGGVDRSGLAFHVRPSPSTKYTHLKPLYLEFASEPSVGIKTMRDFCAKMVELNIEHGILVYQTNMTPSANKIVTTFANKMTIETFNESDLLVNITWHELVPQHILLTPEEKKGLLERYRLQDTQLPRIQLLDPVARYYGLKRGQVVKIIRKSETSGRYASYRIVS